MSDFLDPRKVIEEIEIKDDISVADFGCGSGGWIIPLAKKRKNVKIYAVDVLPQALSALRGNAEMEKVYNIRTIRADIEKGVDIKDGAIDLLIMSNLLFQTEDKEAVIREGKRVLREKGELIVVDWLIKEDNAEEVIDKKIREQGFNLIKNINAGDTHFAKLYEKN